MDIKRNFWLKKLNQAWTKAPIVWLAGVRRSGKTTLSQSIENSTYINCDLSRHRQQLENPEEFYQNLKTEIVIFDEIHQLEEASELLKIGADHFKKKKILATGSSTLVASKKFKDSLTGRKRNIHFLPVLVSEIDDFKVNLKKRILHGGLPPSLMSEKLDHGFFAEWLDSFYARDIQEIFNVDKRQPFLKTLEYLLIANGHQFEVTKLAQAAGVSRPTVVKYLDILDSTKAITLLKPFSNNPLSEIVSQPKVYGFDTGFSLYAKGIEELRSEDYGLCLENLTLETLQSFGYDKQLHYWRTKTKKEIDFVINLNRKENIIIECKWQEKNFQIDAFELFRKDYPHGSNWVVTSDSKTRLIENKKMKIQFINIKDLHSFVDQIDRKF